MQRQSVIFEYYSPTFFKLLLTFCFLDFKANQSAKETNKQTNNTNKSQHTTMASAQKKSNKKKRADIDVLAKI